MSLIQSIDWFKTIQSISGVWVAVVATVALTAWRRQIKANKQVNFLDSLTDTAHAFIISISAPISFLRTVKIGIQSHNTIQQQSPEVRNSGAVGYIEKHGEFDSQMLRKHLDELQPILIKLKSLVTKGQVFRISNYSECQELCNMLEWSFNQIMAFDALLSFKNKNWESSVVQETLEKVLSIEPDSIQENIEKQNAKLLIFVSKAYKSIMK